MIHGGESATAGAALMMISDLAHVHLTIYVPEADLGRVYLGQPAEARVDAYPDRVFPGRVTYIASQAEFTPRSVQTKEERVNMVFAVKIALDNAEGILKPGMPADAKLLP
jgi:HlyD family secretion protein